MRLFNKLGFGLDKRRMLMRVQFFIFISWSAFLLYIFVRFGILEGSAEMLAITSLCLIAIWWNQIQSLIVFKKLQEYQDQKLDFTDYVKWRVIHEGDDPLEVAKIDSLIDEWCALTGKPKNALGRMDCVEMEIWVSREFNKRYPSPT